MIVRRKEKPNFKAFIKLGDNKSTPYILKFFSRVDLVYERFYLGMDAQNVDKGQKERPNLLCSIRTGSLSEVPDRDKVDLP